MPHPLELPVQAQIDALYRMSIGQIKPVVRFIGRALEVTGTHPGGAPIFGTNYVDIDLDISNRVRGKITVSMEKPRIANDDETGIVVSEIGLDIINTDEYFAVTQTAAILSPADIDNAEIQIFARLEGVTDVVPIYRGRVISRPVESRGLCQFRIRDIGWNIIRKPMLHEFIDRIPVTILPGGGVQYPGNAVSVVGQQGIDVDDFNLLSSERRVTTPNGYIAFYSGIVTFSALGDPIVDVTNNDPSKIKIRTINIKNKAKLGRYKLLFDGKHSFTLTYPDNSTYSGNLFEPFTSPAVDIPLAAWALSNINYTTGTFLQPSFDVDARGVEIEFQVWYTVSGNPGTIIKNLIEKGLAENVGTLPNTGSGTNPYTQLRVDWPTFDEMEKRFADICVFVSETNKDNSVWERKTGNQPVSWLRIAQRVADHVASFIVIQPDGLITVKLPYIDDTTIYDLTTEEAITAHTINPVDQFNYLSVQYAYDHSNNAYLVSADKDFRTFPEYEENRITVNAPYFKGGVSKRQAEWLRDTLARHYYPTQVSLNITVTPQMGLTLLPGDKVQLISREQPRIETYAEIRKVDKTIGGTCNIEATPIDNPEGAAFTLCISGFGGELLF
ncbi:MAG: hypothetical protein GWN62_16860 [Aliifodinibius sp.]|nr:hypothetical protein [Fodinibius sp.]